MRQNETRDADSPDGGKPSLSTPAMSHASGKTQSFAIPLRPVGRHARFSRFGARAFLVSLLLGSALITLMSVPYFDFETLPPFVIEKLPLRFERLWLLSLRIHVAAAALSFPLCLALMTRASQRRVRLHRWLGRSAGTLVLFALVPSGTVLAFEAKGGHFVTLGFLISALVMASAMIEGVRAARRHDLVRHARAMRHVLGQMSVAVVSRVMIVGLDAVGSDPETAYVLALWLPVLGSITVVEWLSRRPISKRKPIAPNERICRESSPLAIVLHKRAVLGPVARDGR